MPDNVVEAARRLLNDHHGPPMGPVTDNGRAWYCNKKSCIMESGQRFDNRAFRMSCHRCGGHKRDCHHSDVPLKNPSKRVGGKGGGGSGGGGGGGEKTAKEKQQAKRILELEEQIRNQGKGKGGDKP